jgi:hypothetical protein
MFTREIPIDDEYDVVVAGGGLAGSTAAICAARLGAKVLLAEATGCFGGMGTSGLVTSFDMMADGKQLLVRGFMEELVEKMYERNFLAPKVGPDRWRKNFHCEVPFKVEGLKLILDELTVQAGVEVRYFTRIIDADVHQAQVNGVILHNIEGCRYIRAKAFIDATGDAVLAERCGVSCREAGRDSARIMPATLCALFTGIDWTQAVNHLEAHSEQITVEGQDNAPNPPAQSPPYYPGLMDCYQKALHQAILDGHFTHPDLHLVGMYRVGQTIGILNGGHIFDLDALRCKSVTDGMMLGRKLALEFTEFFRKYILGYEHIELVSTAPLMGVRESRRIVGEYELSFDDFMARRHFPDQIGVYNKSVDIHPYDCSKEEYERFTKEYKHDCILREGESFGIPYGILVPKGWGNLWVAGRCNSSDVKVHSSIRSMPPASMMGQAVGTAAVQSIRTGQPACDLETADLVETLRQAGAYLPQSKLSKTLTR